MYKFLPFYVLKHRFLSVFSIAVLIAFIGWSGLAWANVNSVTATPSSFTVQQLNGATLNVTWNVNRTEGPGGPGGAPIVRNISSPSAFLRLNGSMVTTLAGNLSQNSGLQGPGGTETVNISETITITPSQAALVAGGGTVTIQRTFSDTQSSATGTINLSVISPPGATATNPAGTDLSVERIQLSFENGSYNDVIAAGEPLRAVAEVRFNNNGLLRGEWRLVDPTASLGVSGGRVLQVMRQQLVSSGQGTMRIVSPLLPTKQNGLYLLSFSVSDTDTAINTPIIRYFVLQGDKGVIPENLTVLTPGNNISVTPETVFSWNANPQAEAYEVQILRNNSEELVAGKLVPATEKKLSLSAISFDHFEPGQSYEWRVRAFANGEVIGQSRRYKLKTPQD
jgi:hypothetical protein